MQANKTSLNQFIGSERTGSSILLTFYILLYIFSNNNYTSDFVLIESKHLFLSLVAFFTILLRPKIYVYQIFLFVLSLFYLLNGLFLYSLMVIAFAFAVQSFSAFVDRIPIKILTATVLLLVAYHFLIVSGSLWDTTYGRPRLLAGFHHPKEFAVLIFSIFILYWYRSKKLGLVSFTLSLLILFFVDSRAILLTLATFGFSYFLLNIFGIKAIYLIFLLALLFLTMFAISVFDPQVFNYFDHLSSFRLSKWLERVFSIGVYTANFRGKFGADSFIVELFLLSGVAGLVWFFSFIFWAFYKLSLHQDFLSIFSLSLLISTIVASLFDTGFASTGHLLHILCWSFVAAASTRKNEAL